MKILGYIIIVKRSGSDGTPYPLTSVSSSCSIGRGIECDIRVQLPGVSSQHCRIEVEASGKAYITNLSSSNPVHLNNVQLCPEEIQMLCHQDLLHIAERKLRWEYPEDSILSVMTRKSNNDYKILTPTSKAPIRHQNDIFSGEDQNGSFTEEMLDARRKKVSFGRELDPEHFDKKLPPATPVRKGEKPGTFSSPAIPTSTKKGRMSMIPSTPSIAEEPVCDTPTKSLLRRRSPTPVKPYLARSLGLLTPKPLHQEVSNENSGSPQNGEEKSSPKSPAGTPKSSPTLVSSKHHSTPKSSATGKTPTKTSNSKSPKTPSVETPKSSALSSSRTSQVKAQKSSGTPSVKILDSESTGTPRNSPKENPKTNQNIVKDAVLSILESSSLKLRRRSELDDMKGEKKTESRRSLSCKIALNTANPVQLEDSPIVSRSSPALTRESTPRVSRQSSPTVSRESTPRVSRQSSPTVSRESTPRVSRQSSLVLSRESTPRVSRQSSPTVSRESTPRVSRQSSPVLSSESTPRVSRQSSPTVSRESTPRVSRQSSPVLSRESTPRVSRRSSPAASRESTPRVSRQSSPVLSREATPRVSRQSSPTVSTDSTAKTMKTSTPRVSRTSSPLISSEPSPRTSRSSSPGVSLESSPSPRLSMESSPKFPIESKNITPKTSRNSSLVVSQESTPKTSRDSSPEVAASSRKCCRSDIIQLLGSTRSSPRKLELGKRDSPMRRLSSASPSKRKLLQSPKGYTPKTPKLSTASTPNLKTSVFKTPKLSKVSTPKPETPYSPEDTINALELSNTELLDSTMECMSPISEIKKVPVRSELHQLLGVRRISARSLELGIRESPMRNLSNTPKAATSKMEIPNIPLEYAHETLKVDSPKKTSKVNTPKTFKADTPRTPKADTPRTPKTPKANAPKTPKADMPKTPEIDTPKTPKVDTPKTPKVDTPKTPKVDKPKTPKVDTPKTPKADTPKTPKADTPKTPEADTPKTPEIDTPKAHTPKTPKPKTPKVDTPKTQTAEIPNEMNNRKKNTPVRSDIDQLLGNRRLSVRGLDMGKRNTPLRKTLKPVSAKIAKSKKSLPGSTFSTSQGQKRKAPSTPDSPQRKKVKYGSKTPVPASKALNSKPSVRSTPVKSVSKTPKKSWADVLKKGLMCHGIPAAKAQHASLVMHKARIARQKRKPSISSNTSIPTFSEEIPQTFNFSQSTGHVNSPAPIFIGKRTSAKTPKVYRKGQKPVLIESKIESIEDIDFDGLVDLLNTPKGKDKDIVKKTTGWTLPDIVNHFTPLSKAVRLRAMYERNGMTPVSKASKQEVKTPESQSDTMSIASSITPFKGTLDESISSSNIFSPITPPDAGTSTRRSRSSVGTPLNASTSKKSVSSISNTPVSNLNTTGFDFGDVRTPNVTEDQFISPLATPEVSSKTPERLFISTQKSALGSPISLEADVTMFDFENVVTPAISPDIFVSPMSTRSKLGTPRVAKLKALDSRTQNEISTPESQLTVTPTSSKRVTRNSIGDSITTESTSLEIGNEGNNLVATPKIDASNNSVQRVLRTPRSSSSSSSFDDKNIDSPAQATGQDVENLKADDTDVLSVKRVLRTPRITNLEPEADYTQVAGMKKLLQTPQPPPSSPQADYTNVAGMKKLLKTPCPPAASPQADYTNVPGIKKLFQTPCAPPKSPASDLTNVAGVKKLMSTPSSPAKEPEADYTNVTGMRKLLKTPRALPSSPMADYTNVIGLRNLTKTPKEAVPEREADYTHIRGVRKVLRTPKAAVESPKADYTQVAGMKKLLSTPTVATTECESDYTNVAGLKNLMSTPGKKQKGSHPPCDYTSPRGLKKLMSTPKQTVSEPLCDFTNVSGLKRLLKSPDVLTQSPQADYTQVHGVRNLLRTPKVMSATEIEYEGLGHLMKTPLADNTNVVEKIFDLVNTASPLRKSSRTKQIVSTQSSSPSENIPPMDEDLQNVVDLVRDENLMAPESPRRSNRKGNASKNTIQETCQLKAQENATLTKQNVRGKRKADLDTESIEAKKSKTADVQVVVADAEMSDITPSVEHIDVSKQNSTEVISEEQILTPKRSARSRKVKFDIPATTQEIASPSQRRTGRKRAVKDMTEESVEVLPAKKNKNSKKEENTKEIPTESEVEVNEPTQSKMDIQVETTTARKSRSRKQILDEVKAAAQTVSEEKSSPATGRRGRRTTRAVPQEEENVQIKEGESTTTSPVKPTRSRRGQTKTVQAEEPSKVAEETTVTKSLRGRAVSSDNAPEEVETSAEEDKEKKVTKSKRGKAAVEAKSDDSSEEEKVTTKGRRGRAAASKVEVKENVEPAFEEKTETTTKSRRGRAAAKTEIVEEDKVVEKPTRGRRGKAAAKVEIQIEEGKDEPGEDKVESTVEEEKIEKPTRGRSGKAATTVEKEVVETVEDKTESTVEEEKIEKPTRSRRGRAATKVEIPTKEKEEVVEEKVAAKGRRGKAAAKHDKISEDEPVNEEKPTTKSRRGKAAAVVEVEEPKADEEVPKKSGRQPRGKKPSGDAEDKKQNDIAKETIETPEPKKAPTSRSRRGAKMAEPVETEEVKPTRSRRGASKVEPEDIKVSPEKLTRRTRARK